MNETFQSANPQDYNPKIDRAAIDAAQPVSFKIDIDEKHRQHLERYVSDELVNCDKEREARLERYRTWRKTLSGLRPAAPYRRGVSNLSVPLSIWACSAMRGRVIQGALRTRPLITAFCPGTLTAEDLGGTDPNHVAKALAKFLEADFRNPLGLNGDSSCGSAAAEFVNLGTAAIKVAMPPDRVLMVYNPNNGEGAEQREAGKITIDQICLDDLIVTDGFGTNTQEMPLVGHYYETTWADIKMWEKMEHFDGDAVKRVSTHYDGVDADRPAPLRNHRLAELYFSFVTKENKLPCALIVTWHRDAKIALRIAWNPYPRGARPIFTSHFDLPPTSNMAFGQGVCEKLEGVQDEIDTIHNIGIESGKRAAANLLVFNPNSGTLEQDLGGDETVLPGETAGADHPMEDINSVQLGNPQGVGITMELEAQSLRYVFRMLGFDESGLGQVESGKRVPASLGLSAKRDGRIVAVEAINNFAKMINDAIHLVLALNATRLSSDILLAVLNEEDARAVANVIASLDERTMRSQFVISVNAVDAAAASEERKQELLTLQQFLMGYYQQLLQYAQMAAQMPPPFRDALVAMMTKIENGFRILLSSIDSIPNPDEVIFEVAQLEKLLKSIAPGMPTGAPPTPMETDLGAGVA
jgi:hypothetical protein